MGCKARCTPAPGQVQAQATDCINLIGDGSAPSPLEAIPIIDPRPTNILTCGPAGLLAEEVCAPEITVAGVPPVGSVPLVTTDILGGPYVITPLAVSPYPMTEIGPQFDLMVANPSPTCSFDLSITIDGPATQGILEPGAELQVGVVIGTPGLNLPPVDLTPADFYAPQYYRTNVAGVPEPFSDGTGTKDQITVLTIGPLDPGDFIWLSVQTLIATAGFTGASAISFPTGYGLSVQGVRL